MLGDIFLVKYLTYLSQQTCEIRKLFPFQCWRKVNSEKRLGQVPAAGQQQSPLLT